MKRVLLAAILSLLAVPALAQTAPGSLGGNQVGTGAVEPQGNAGGPNSASAGTAITSTPSAGATTSPAATGSTTAGSGSSSGGSGGGGHGGGMEALCLSTSGSVASVDADEFGIDCPQ